MGNLKNIRIVLWYGLGVVLVWLLYLGVVPDGKTSYVYDFKKPNYFIAKLTPEDRLKPVANGQQAMIGDPAYFSLRTPRTFDKARLTIKFNNPNSLPVIEAGVLADNKLWRYQTQPIKNLKIEELSERWNVIKEGNAILLERKKVYGSINDFLSNPPNVDTVAVYNYNFDKKYNLAGYQKSDRGISISHPLRGNYQFFTYLKNEPLDLVLEIADLNKNRDSDPVELRIYQGGNLINSKILADDGNKDDDGKMSKPRELRIKLPMQNEGVYKIELVANNDIVTRKISTNLNRLAFVNRLWLASGGGRTKLYSDSHVINAQTINPGSLQKIAVGELSLDIAETYRQYSIGNPGKMAEIEIGKDDMIISGDGVFAFDRAAFVNPGPKKMSAGFDADRDGIDYILANYEPGFVREGEWQYASAEFDLKNAYRESNRYSFLISVPGLKADDPVDDAVVIDEIRVDLEGRSLWQKLKTIMLK